MNKNSVSVVVIGLVWLGLLVCSAYGIDPVRPVKGQIYIQGQQFHDDNGPIQLVGYSDYNEFSGKGEAYQAPAGYIKRISSSGLNFARVFIDFTIDSDEWLSIQTVEVNGAHAKLTPQFRTRLKEGLNAALKHGVVVELVLFDACCYCGSGKDRDDMTKGHAHWYRHVGDGAKSNFDIINSPNLMSAQMEYVNEVLSISAAYPNVIYELANELGNGHSRHTPNPEAWATFVGNLIRLKTPAPISISVNRDQFGTETELLPVIDFTGEHGSCPDEINADREPVDAKVRGIDWGRPIIWDNDGCWRDKEGRHDPARVSNWAMMALKTGHSYNHKSPTPQYTPVLDALGEVVRTYNAEKSSSGKKKPKQAPKPVED